jgi:hypothetical protein
MSVDILRHLDQGLPRIHRAWCYIAIALAILTVVFWPTPTH